MATELSSITSLLWVPIPAVGLKIAAVVLYSLASRISVKCQHLSVCILNYAIPFSVHVHVCTGVFVYKYMYIGVLL